MNNVHDTSQVLCSPFFMWFITMYHITQISCSFKGGSIFMLNVLGMLCHHHHHRLYSPGWVLASSSKCRQWSLSWGSACQFPQPSFLASSSTPSIHLDFGQPRTLWPPGFVHNIHLGNSFSSIPTTWPTHLSLLDFITLTIFGSL